MDTPPEARKFPKCRLVVILIFILLVSLILLAGYCGWLFLSYYTDVDKHSSDSLEHAAIPTKVASLQGDVRIGSTALPDLERDVTIQASEIYQNSDSSEDFMFVSSVESVYDSSEPYGNSAAYSSSSSTNVHYEYSYSETSSDDTTRKEDQYLLGNTKEISPFERIKQFLSNFRNGKNHDISEVPAEPSYEVKSSYWYKQESENESGNDDNNIDDSSWGDVFDSDWTGDGDGMERYLESLSFGDATDDLLFDSFSEDYYDGSGSGSGDDEWSEYYDQWRPDHIPPPMTSPPVIDQLPPERIEISVCNWPKKLLDEMYDGSMKYAMKSRPEYDVLGLSVNNVSITQMVSERDGSATVKIFMRDYVNSIVAVRYSVKTAMASASNCYFSFLTPDLEEDALTNDDRYVIDDEMGGSGYLPEDELQEFTLEIENPVLLGGDLPMFNEPISDICKSSKKYWASSIHVKH